MINVYAYFFIVRLCASSSNRDFKSRQGSAFGRTLPINSAMVAAAVIAARVIDVHEDDSVFQASPLQRPESPLAILDSMLGRSKTLTQRFSSLNLLIRGV
jgi:hypothetical protein